MSTTLTPFDALVRRAFGPTFVTRPISRPLAVPGFTPAAEVTRAGDDAVVRLEIPGVDVEKDVTVEVKDNTLVVRGERRDERSSEENGRTLREVRYGSFRRSFGLPAGVTAEAVSASYDAGVLTVTVAGAYADANDAHRVAITTGAAERPAETPAVEGETK